MSKNKRANTMLGDWRVSQHYAVKINSYIADLIEPTNDPQGVIAAQYVPDARELVVQDDELSDPIGDDAYSPVKGIVHRYPDRALLKVTPACPVYCRYCFRKTMVGPQGSALNQDELDAALSYIENQKQLWEVILTGGDPLTLSPRRLQSVLSRLDGMDHVDVIRIHTRAVAAAPLSMNDDMIAALSGVKMRYLVMHVNHENELTDEVISAVKKLRRAGFVILSQSVLLKNVNDNAPALEALFRGLVRIGVKPYMLHHLDRAPGTAHFRVSIKHGQEIMRALRGRVSGLCLPEYMLDIPGGHGKVPLTPRYCEASPDGLSYSVCDYLGGCHHYDDRD